MYFNDKMLIVKVENSKHKFITRIIIILALIIDKNTVKIKVYFLTSNYNIY